MSRYLSCAWVRPPGAGLGVGDGAGVGLGGIVPRPGTMVPVIAVAATVPAGVIVAVMAVALGAEALGSGVPRRVAAPPHAAAKTRASPSVAMRIPLLTSGRLSGSGRAIGKGSVRGCGGRRFNARLLQCPGRGDRPIFVVRPDDWREYEVGAGDTTVHQPELALRTSTRHVVAGPRREGRSELVGEDQPRFTWPCLDVLADVLHDMDL